MVLFSSTRLRRGAVITQSKVCSVASPQQSGNGGKRPRKILAHPRAMFLGRWLGCRSGRRANVRRHRLVTVRLSPFMHLRLNHVNEEWRRLPNDALLPFAPRASLLEECRRRERGAQRREQEPQQNLGHNKHHCAWPPSR